jgi:hypothetical protein
VTKQLFAAALCRASGALEYCFPQFPGGTPKTLWERACSR